MNSVTFTMMDLLQIFLLLAACYACYVKGIQKGVGDTLEFFAENGLLEKEEED